MVGGKRILRVISELNVASLNRQIIDTAQFITTEGIILTGARNCKESYASKKFKHMKKLC